MRNNLTRQEFTDEVFNDVVEVPTYNGDITRYGLVDSLGLEKALRALDDEDIEALRKRKIYKKDFDYMIQAVRDFEELVFNFRIAKENLPFDLDKVKAGELEDTKNYFQIKAQAEMLKLAMNHNELLTKAYKACHAIYANIKPDYAREA
jgi:hypothetical protein